MCECSKVLKPDDAQWPLLGAFLKPPALPVVADFATRPFSMGRFSTWTSVMSLTMSMQRGGAIRKGIASTFPTMESPDPGGFGPSADPQKLFSAFTIEAEEFCRPIPFPLM